MSYLRNRPFLIISYMFVPATGQNTSAKDFASKAEYNAVENMVIVDRVSDKHMVQADLIIDLFNQKIVKNRSLPGTAEELTNKFVARYADDVKAALATWIKLDPSNLDRVRNYVAEVQARTDAAKEAGEANVEGDSN